MVTERKIRHKEIIFTPAVIFSAACPAGDSPRPACSDRGSRKVKVERIRRRRRQDIELLVDGDLDLVGWLLQCEKCEER